jgi:hypothetical protein
MDIECKLKREGGTQVDLGKNKYHFAPREDGAHVAFVESEEHQDRFLGIPEAYRVYRGSAAAPVIETKTYSDGSTATGTAPLPDLSPAQQDALKAAPGYLDSYEFHGKTYALDEIVALAQKGSGLDAAEWNELEDESRADLIDEQLDKLNADANADGVVDNSEERAALAAEYKAKFGKAPHGKWNADTIRAKLAE